MCRFNDPEIRRSLGRPKNRQVDVLQEEQLAALEDEEAGRQEFSRLRLGFAKTWIIPRIVTAENHHRF